MPRDINGVYALPAGNPVVPGTVISTTWANATLNDIAAALTASITQTAADARYANITGDTFTGGVTVPSLNGGQLAGLRNNIINGACLVSQRGPTPFNTQGVYIYGAVDRFVSAVSGAATWSADILQADIGNKRKAQQIVFTNTGNATLQIGQRIESRNTFYLVNSEVTFSGTLFHDLISAQNFTVRLYYPSANDTFGNGQEVYIGSTVISVQPNSETRFKLTVTVPTEGARGLLAEVVSTVSASTYKSILTWNWQLEKGTVVSPFENRPYGLELGLCQRYYYRTNVGGSAVVNTNGFSRSFPFPVRMRVQPASSTNVTNANHAPASPGSGQWSLEVLGAALCTKTGTETIQAASSSADTGIICGYGATYSSPGNFLSQPDNSLYADFSAEL